MAVKRDRRTEIRLAKEAHTAQVEQLQKDLNALNDENKRICEEHAQREAAQKEQIEKLIAERKEIFVLACAAAKKYKAEKFAATKKIDGLTSQLAASQSTVVEKTDDIWQLKTDRLRHKEALLER